MNSAYFDTERDLVVGEKKYRYFSLQALEKQGYGDLVNLPYTYRILLEGLLRHQGEKGFLPTVIRELSSWKSSKEISTLAIPFLPVRILLQDFTGIPVLNDLASFRTALERQGKDPCAADIKIPCDLVVDHSIQVDTYGSAHAQQLNEEIEFKRNRERYEFLRWTQNAFHHLRIFPPGSGIIHQINLEYLAQVVTVNHSDQGVPFACPDTLLGTDSHTTMVNGLGVLGWGVGGIEALSVMLGYPTEISLPGVIGLRLGGELPAGANPTDLTLTLTSILRKRGVVGKIIEVFGPAVKTMRLEDRAMVANMSPESGATATFFPVDEQTLNYLRLTGRNEAHIRLVEAYCKEQGLFQSHDGQLPQYAETIDVDINCVEAVIAGPKRPFDLIPVGRMAEQISKTFSGSTNQPHSMTSRNESPRSFKVNLNGKKVEIPQGAVVLAAITSCTNTANPYIILGAGLMAKKAVEKGLHVPRWVKTSLAPGSRTVTTYLQRSGLLPFLNKLGFYVVGYGCTTCIGNSGPLADEIVNAIVNDGLLSCAFISGNRNFEGRIHKNVQASFLASPLMVIASALAGRIDFDFERQPLARDENGKEIYLREVYPTREEIEAIIEAAVQPDLFINNYQHILTDNANWNSLASPQGATFQWRVASTYLHEAPFLSLTGGSQGKPNAIQGARVLVFLQDSITTDHISPAGEVPLDSAAGCYLTSLGNKPQDFNTYGAYRGNHEVMVRGTFANSKLKNLLAPEKVGGYTEHIPTGKVLTIFEAAMQYQREKTPLIILAGKNYGTGSSRDWASKGPALLGVKAILAESFERIHRSNLVMLGILPLQFKEDQNAFLIGLTGRERFFIQGIDNMDRAGAELRVEFELLNGGHKEFYVSCRIDTDLELEYFRHRGILPYILAKMTGSEKM